MFFNSLAVLFLASSALAVPQSRADTPLGRKCGTNPTELQALEGQARYAAAAMNVSRIASKRPMGPDGLLLAAAPVPVHWHIIVGRDTKTNLEIGDLTTQAITDSMTVLNKAYAVMGLSFTLVNVTRTVDPMWFAYVGPMYQIQTDMKTLLHTGNQGTLNVYTSGFLSGASADVLGYSTLPSDYTFYPIDDGVVVRYSTVPGGAQPLYNQGMTLVHEVGHWCGLLHPFQGGCFGSGDLVDDTPSTAAPISGCPVGLDTCPGGGLDLANNFMDYGTDACVTSFTPGQIARAKQQLAAFRGIVL